MSKTSRDLTYIEIMRVICCMGVFVEHFSASFAIERLKWLRAVTAFTPFLYLNDGRMAINMFCTIGGFLILRTSVGEKGDVDVSRVRQALVKRILYLYISCAILCMLSVLIIKASLLYNHQAYLAGAGDYINNVFTAEPTFYNLLVCLKGIVWGKTLFAPQLWTIRYDILAGGACLVLIMIFREHRVARWCSYPVWFAVTVFIMHNSYALAFMCGMAACELTYLKPFPDKRKPVSFLLMLVCLTLSACAYTLGRHALVPVFDSAFLYIAHTVFGNKRAGSKIIRALSSLGGISFSFYLCHFIIIVTLSARLYCLFEPVMSRRSAFIINFVLTLLTVLVISYLYDRYIIKNVSRAIKAVIIARPSKKC